VAEESNESRKYYYEVDFETWERAMKELIEKQRRELKRYKQLVGNTVDEVRKNYYTAMINQLRSIIIQNEDELRLGRLEREGSIYYVDENGTPTRVWVGPTLKREHELRKRYLDAMFV